jgi:BASS family bile acid:Na+ symporter
MNHRLSLLGHFLHSRLLWLLFAVYALASVAPGPALALRKIFVVPAWAASAAGASSLLPALLLAFLLFNAGLGTRFAALRWIRQSSLVMGAGTLANLVAPLLAILAVNACLHLWHNPAEYQSILTGMVLIGSMPIAGSSTAWAQNADGDLTVSLGLVLLSTAISPMTTPLLLRAGSWITAGSWSRHLQELAGQGTGVFLIVFVVLPALTGIVTRLLLGDDSMRRIQPAAKVANTAVLILLCYLNAAVSLPRIVAHPDADFLLLVFVVTVFLCVVMFGAGWLLARLLRLDHARQAPLVFGLGMNNNGAGLVVAAGALPDQPLVLLPILLYNLVQHFAAGIADCLLSFKAKPKTSQ